MGGGLVELAVGQAFHVIALNETDVFKAGQAEGFTEVVEELARTGIVVGLFFNENAVHQGRCCERHWMLGAATARASGMDGVLVFQGSPKGIGGLGTCTLELL